MAFQLFCTPLVKPPNHIPSAFKFAEILTEPFNGKSINGYRWNKGKAVRVLILHGFSSSSYKFHRYVLPLVEKGYEVIAFDAPAHGGSDGKTLNAVEYEMMIEKLIRIYGPFNGFIAHSFGGLALSLAMEKTPHDANTKIVLIAPATETVTAIDGAFEMLKLKNKNVRKAFDEIILKMSNKPTEWYSVNRAMENIKASVLWIHDKDDAITPLKDALKTKEKQYPNIRFIITGGLGHRQIYHDEKIKNEVFNFL
ncbi:MAG: alpha/beta hydrolase [Chitinophagaceae bacterium]|nr:alpha/beta hydrolase [Chitinophagaceae bacterium]